MNLRDACTGPNPAHDDCGADDPNVCACPCHGWYDTEATDGDPLTVPADADIEAMLRAVREDLAGPGGPWIGATVHHCSVCGTELQEHTSSAMWCPECVRPVATAELMAGGE